MARRPFNYLRARLVERDLDFEYIALELGRSPAYVSQCMNNRACWRINEMYLIMEMIGEPPERLHIVFPENGRIKQPEAGERLQVVREVGA